MQHAGIFMRIFLSLSEDESYIFFILLRCCGCLLIKIVFCSLTTAYRSGGMCHGCSRYLKNAVKRQKELHTHNIRKVYVLSPVDYANFKMKNKSTHITCKEKAEKERHVWVQKCAKLLFRIRENGFAHSTDVL